jgi:short subunit dehydrogenase-like uncharacterized protein
MADPRYDIVLFGATSFVGKLLAHYLFTAYGTDGEISWAIAGRSKAKLAMLQSELGKGAANLDLLVVDASDEGTLLQICQSTRVMVSTVGPYALHGEPLIRACAESGADYCDLTGEVQWISKMITLYEAKARASGARIVHCCGFDSIPSDLGVFFLQAQAKTLLGRYCHRVKMRVCRMKGEFSGGTVASLMNVVKEASKDPQLRKELTNPYSICPPDHNFSARQQTVSSPRRDRDFKCWIAPFVMAAVNSRVVHRSNALSGAVYGNQFLYDEAMMMGTGLAGFARASTLSAAMAGFMTAAAIPPSRWALERFIMPKPGDGPSEQAQQAGFFDIRFFGETEDGKSIFTKVTGDRDPGYGSTAKMLGQAAICLARDIPQTEKSGGFWTPSTVLGQRLLERLQAHAGITFELC